MPIDGGKPENGREVMRDLIDQQTGAEVNEYIARGP